MKHTLEEQRIFPIIAWLLVFGFALFTIHLTYTTAQAIASINNSITEKEVTVP